SASFSARMRAKGLGMKPPAVTPTSSVPVARSTAASTDCTSSAPEGITSATGDHSIDSQGDRVPAGRLEGAGHFGGTPRVDAARPVLGGEPPVHELEVDDPAYPLVAAEHVDDRHPDPFP